MNEQAMSNSPETFGRYVLYPAIARGGMASVHPARLLGAEGFSRLVAAKRLHAHFADDPEFVGMFHDEARIASMIHHPNVVPVLDVVMSGSEVILVQEYVHGVPLNQLGKTARAEEAPIPIPIVVAIVTGVLAGLHAAHEASDEFGKPIQIIHRDVSPQNVMVTVDGVPRLLDFGIAKAKTSSHHTRDGVFKGKLSYMAPEQLRMEPVTRAADIYAVGVLLWELLVNARFYDGQDDAEFVAKIVSGAIPRVTDAVRDRRGANGDHRVRQLATLDTVVACALASCPTDRFATAAEMSSAMLAVLPAATPLEVAQWVKRAGTEYLDRSQRALASNDESWRNISLSPQSRSGIQVVSLPPPTEPVLPTTAPTAVSSFSELSHAAGRGRSLPWIFIAGLLVVTGVLAGVLGANRSREGAGAFAAPRAEMPASPATFTAAAPGAQRSELALAPPVPAPSMGPSVVDIPPPPNTTQAQRPPERQPLPHARTLPPTPTHMPTAQPGGLPLAPSSSLAQPTSTSSAKVECSPPYYFEGSKKVFKASCL